MRIPFVRPDLPEASSVAAACAEIMESGILTKGPRLTAFEEAVRLGTRPETSLRIATPVISMSKAEIVRQGIALGVPFERTWSCYQAEEKACGACESCRLRLRGIREAGAADPIPYRTPA